MCERNLHRYKSVELNIALKKSNPCIHRVRACTPVDDQKNAIHLNKVKSKKINKIKNLVSLQDASFLTFNF